MLRVWLWRGHVDATGGAVVADLACATEDPAGLRTACAAAGVARPSRAQRARATDDVVQLALAHPGQVLALAGRDPHWQVLPLP